MLSVVIAIAGPDGDCQVVNEEEWAATDSSRILEYEHCYSGKTETDKVPENLGGTSKNTVSRGSCARVYRSTSEKEFPWLSTSENQKLFCSLCRLAKMKNAFATTGACTYAVYFSDTHVCFAALQCLQVVWANLRYSQPADSWSTWEWVGAGPIFRKASVTFTSSTFIQITLALV